MGARVWAWLGGLTVLAAALAATSALQPRLQPAAFDLWQRLLPREQPAEGVVLVAIDDASVAAIGHAPWPRARLAELMRTVLAARPAAVGLETIVAGPDPLSPSRLMAAWPEATDTLRAELAALPDAHAQLAESIDVGPVALAVAGHDEAGGATPPQRYRTPLSVRGGDPVEHVRGWPGTLASLPALREAAAGQGATDAPADPDGVLRRLPALVQYGGTPMPTLALEMLRLASRGERISVQLDPVGLLSVSLGERRVPTDANGDWWLHFSAATPAATDPAAAAGPATRTVLPAIALLKDPALAQARLAGRMVLVGYTARGVQDRVLTPRGPMARVELHAEALDNVLGGHLLRRPRGAGAVEAGLAVLLGLGAVAARRLRLRYLLPGALLTSGALVAAGAASFTDGGVLLDMATPLVATWLALGGGLAMSFGEWLWRLRRHEAAALAATRDATAPAATRDAAALAATRDAAALAATRDATALAATGAAAVPEAAGIAAGPAPGALPDALAAHPAPAPAQPRPDTRAGAATGAVPDAMASAATGTVVGAARDMAKDTVAGAVTGAVTGAGASAVTGAVTVAVTGALPGALPGAMTEAITPAMTDAAAPAATAAANDAAPEGAPAALPRQDTRHDRHPPARQTARLGVRQARRQARGGSAGGRPDGPARATHPPKRRRSLA